MMKTVLDLRTSFEKEKTMYADLKHFKHGMPKKQPEIRRAQVKIVKQLNLNTAEFAIQSKQQFHTPFLQTSSKWTRRTAK